MTRDLEAALREAREAMRPFEWVSQFVDDRLVGEPMLPRWKAELVKLTIGDFNRLARACTRIDAALSAASGEASGDDVDLFPIPKAEFFAAVPRPAPSETPNVERACAQLGDHERIWLQPECCAAGSYEGRLWCEDPDPAPCEDGVPWTEYVRADLFDSARAEGIAAEKKRCADIAGWFEDHEDDPAVARCAGLIAETISREAKP